MLVAVVGPTGTGKSALSLDLAERLRADGREAEIVNADAMQLYRGMDIGTAKLRPEERRGIPHHLLDVLDPRDEASVARYQVDARAVIDDILARDAVAILVGGSGLYVSSVLYDFRFPGTDAGIRARLEAELAEHGPGMLHRRLREVDPVAADAIGAANARRLVRALEVVELTGEPFGAGLDAEQRPWRPSVTLGLRLDRAVLVERLDARVAGMWRDGLVEEVASLLPAGLGVTASRAIGYAQAAAQLAGDLTEAAAIEQAALLTRKYARRQVSWFGRFPDTVWLDADDPGRLDAAWASLRPAPPPRGDSLERVSIEIAFTKGHGTGNDFVLFADPDGRVDLDASDLAALADRHFGVGGDGVIRAVRSAHLPEGAAILAEDPGAEWFMDYHNADGSPAEMCGNGIRVYGSYLLDQGLLDLAVGETVSIGTRGGVRQLTRTPDGFEVDLGPFVVAGEAMVAADGLHVDRPGLAVGVGNPHVVVALADETELDALDLGDAPVVSPPPPDGVNVEFVVPAEPLVQAGVGRIRMRVHERGSGETLSCGTGAAAAALATRHWAGSAAPDAWSVEVPGGTVGVRVVPTANGDHVLLSGPAELVFSGTMKL